MLRWQTRWVVGTETYTCLTLKCKYWHFRIFEISSYVHGSFILFRPTSDYFQTMYPGFWFCESDLVNGSNFGSQSDWNLNTSERKYGNHRKSKESECIEILKSYQYEIEAIYDQDNEKSRKMYKCKHGDWDRSFTIIWNLLDHVRMHNGVKPHICTTCGKRFTQMGNFRKHMRTHEDSDINKRKKHQCSTWGRRYTEKYNLKVRNSGEL